MGSTGSGSLSDYSKRRPNPEKGGNGGASGSDDCGRAFSATLEDVSRCFYFIDNGKVPPAGTPITVAFNGVRLSVETVKGEEIGYLPTKFNYLKNCLADNFLYTGEVRVSGIVPVPSISVDIVPA